MTARSTAIIALLVALTVGALGTCPNESESRFQLVGFTTHELRGDSGVLGLTASCQQEYAGSRMCTAAEVRDTSVLPDPDLLVGKAWVRREERFRDPSWNLLSETCDDWTSAAPTSPLPRAWVADAVGHLHARSCDEPRFVACCSPRQL